MLVEAESAQEAIDILKSEVRGTIRLACPIALLYAHLGCMLTEFMMRYPQVNIQLDATNRRVDLIGEGVDVAIRVRPPPIENKLSLSHLIDYQSNLKHLLEQVFTGALHYLVARDQKMGLVDPHTGQWLIEADYDYLEKRPCQILKSYKDGLVGLFSFEGKELVPTKYQDVRSFGFQNFFAVQQKGQWGIYEGGSRELVIPTKFDQISYCGGCGSKPEYFYAKKDGHWGLVGFDGQLRLPFEYEFPQHRFMRGDQWVVNLQRDGQELLIHLGTGTHYFNKDYDDVLVLNDPLRDKPRR